jgi:hypothetical protein
MPEDTYWNVHISIQMSTRFQHHFSILFQFRPRSNAVDISLTIPALVNLIFCDSCDRTTTITIHVEIFTSEDSAVGRLFVL